MMNIALSSLFDYTEDQKDKSPRFEAGTNKQQVFDAMVALDRPCCVSDLMEETGLNSNQVQYALRHMKDHGVINIKEIARGAGRTFMYSLPTKLGRPETLMTRIIALFGDGDILLTSSEISKQLNVSVKLIQTTLAYAIKTHSNYGFTREICNGVFFYKGIKE